MFAYEERLQGTTVFWKKKKRLDYHHKVGKDEMEALAKEHTYSPTYLSGKTLYLPSIFIFFRHRIDWRDFVH